MYQHFLAFARDMNWGWKSPNNSRMKSETERLIKLFQMCSRCQGGLTHIKKTSPSPVGHHIPVLLAAVRAPFQTQGKVWVCQIRARMLQEEGGWCRDSWQFELWLNCRRECTERLERVGVKKKHPFLSHMASSHFHTFFYSLSKTNNVFLTFFVPQALFSSHSALGEWRCAASCRQQMKSILYLVKAWTPLK